MARDLLTTFVELAGAGLVVGGLAMFSHRVAFVFAGLLVCAIGFVLSGPPRTPPTAPCAGRSRGRC